MMEVKYGEKCGENCSEGKEKECEYILSVMDELLDEVAGLQYLWEHPLEGSVKVVA